MTTTWSPAGPDGMEVLGPPGAPTVLLLHAWWGLTPEVRRTGERLAAAGRRVVVVDLYAGRTAVTVEEAEELSAALDGARARAAIDVAVAAVDGPWAVVGWSLGAWFAGSLADRGPAALCLFYGGGVPAGRTHSRVQLHLAPDDGWFSDEERDEVHAGLVAAGARVEVHTYPGTSHWFAEADRPEHDPAAASAAWQRVELLLDEVLPV